jgi:serine phosphatase RsbU (regulator of sigma subunit)
MFGQALLTDLVSGSVEMNPAELLEAIDAKLCQQFHDAEGMPTGQMELAVVQVPAGASVARFASARMPVYAATSSGVDMLKSGQVSLGNPLVKFKEYPILELPLEAGQLYFICSDGVADQFGGPEGKKLTRNRLREYLKAATMEFPNPQMSLTLVKENILDWQGTATQTDDILVVAFGTTLEA